MAQIEALQKLDELLDNKPMPTTRTEPTANTRCVTFNETTKPPQENIPSPRMDMTKPPRETVPNPEVDNPSQQTRMITPITKAVVNKSITKIPPPRVEKTHATPLNDKERLRQYLRSKTMARIPQQSMQLRREITHREQAQLIHDKDNGEWLNYCQLLCNPKHKETWTKLAANKFGRLTNRIGG